MFLIRFLMNLTKKGSVESAKYEINKNFLLVLTVLGRFFHGSGSGFSADPDPDSGEQIRSESGKKPGSETLL